MIVGIDQKMNIKITVFPLSNLFSGSAEQKAQRKGGGERGGGEGGGGEGGEEWGWRWKTLNPFVTQH